MRFTVKPQQNEFTEWLEYTFSDMNVNKDGKNSAVVNLMWEKMKIPFTVEDDNIVNDFVNRMIIVNC